MKSSKLVILLIILIFGCGPSETRTPLSPRFNHVVIQVSNMSQSVAFYTTAFDLEVTNELRKLEYTEADGTTKGRDINIVLLKFPGQDFVYEMSEVSLFDSLGDYRLYHHVGIDVKDIEVAYNRAIAAGAESMVPPRLVKAGNIETKQAFLKGPDGEVLELMQLVAGAF